MANVGSRPETVDAGLVRTQKVEFRIQLSFQRLRLHIMVLSVPYEGSFWVCIHPSNMGSAITQRF